MKPHEIERHQAQTNHLEIVLHLRADLFWFRGHFAVQPLLPGVAQIDWAMSYALNLLAPGWRFSPIQNINSSLRCCRKTASRSRLTGRKNARF